MKPVLYLSGPMTGLPDDNYPAFRAAAARLRAAGYTVISPAELDLPRGREWAWYMRHALRAMLEADAVALMPGWWNSRGAKCERDLAGDLEWPVYTVDRWIEIAEAKPLTASDPTNDGGEAHAPQR